MSDRHRVPPNMGGGDRFTSGGATFVDWLQDNFRTFVTVVVLLILAGGGGVLYGKMRSGQAMQAAAQLAEIVSLYPGNGEQVATSQIQAAAEKYEAFLADGPPAFARYAAQLNLARAREALGEADAARAGYEALSSAPEEFAMVARMRLGYLAAGQGDLAAAGATFESVVNNYPGMAPQAGMELGHLAELAGSTDVAIAHYTEVAKTYPDFPQASEAKVRITRLGGTFEEEPAELPEALKNMVLSEGEEAASEEVEVPAEAGEKTTEEGKAE